LLLTLALTYLPLAAQTPEKAKLAAQLDSLSTHLAGLSNRQQILSRQADSLAKDIQRRKRQTPSLLQDRGLDASLRFSQSLADSLQELQQQQQHNDRVLRQKAEQLLKILNEDIDRLAQAGESLKSKKIGATPARGGGASECLNGNAVPGMARATGAPIIIYEVEAKPEDTPETLRRKADFLRDQVDRLQREVKRVDAKLAEINERTKVHERVGDLLTDLSLSDPSREGVTNVSNLTGRFPMPVRKSAYKPILARSWQRRRCSGPLNSPGQPGSTICHLRIWRAGERSWNYK
jgi:chaperonin cofactor prefoldin